MTRQLPNALYVLAHGKGISLPVFVRQYTNIMDFFDGPHYRINKILLSLLGQWPYQTIIRRNITFAILFFLSGTQCLAKICAMATSLDDIDVVLGDLPPFIIDMVAVIKIINCTLKTEKMRLLIDRIEADFSTYSKTGEVQVLKEYAKHGRRFTIMYGGFIYAAACMLIIASVKPLIFETFNSTNERPLLHHVEYFVDTQSFYYPILLHSQVTIAIFGSVIAAIDTMFLVLIQHACGLFATLGYQLHRVAENQPLDLNINPSIFHDKTYQSISECVYRHMKAIEFANLMESYYSVSFFLQAGLNMVGMSVTGLLAVQNMDDATTFFLHLLFSYGEIAHLFFESICAQRLIDHSEQMHEHLINVQWYQTSIRTRKVINLMLIRSRVPCILTAASMFVISMETFSAIVRTSMSYFTVLYSMQ